jgi:hypothetical protein
MALVTTPGAADANSYASVDEFKVYRVNRLPAKALATGAVDASIEIALLIACRSLSDNFTWTGAAVDDVQALTWPRSGMMTRNNFPLPTTGGSSIPQALKDAQCELAYQLLAGVDLVSDNDALKQNISSVKAGSVAVAFQNIDQASPDAIDMLIRRMGSELNYVSNAIPGEVRRLLVPSWFEQPSIKRPVLFQAF